VVGSTTMIFSIIMELTQGLTRNIDKLSLLHAPFLLGLSTGGAVIYWFTGASTQAVTTGAYRAVEFIKANSNLQSTEKAFEAGSTVSHGLAAAFLAISIAFVYRSFYGMRIGSGAH